MGKQLSLMDCKETGCRHLQTTCVKCGRLVIEKILPPCIGWIFMKDEQPKKQGEIIFKSDSTHERIGIVIPEQKMVLLSHTDLNFDEIDYWMEIPEEPK